MSAEHLEWTPALVEDLLFRRFMKGEDITESIPPPPQCDVSGYTRLYDQASRAMQQYVRNGPPVVPLSTLNTNVLPASSKTATPMKSLLTPTAAASTTLFAPPPPLAAVASQPPTGPKTPMAKAVAAAAQGGGAQLLRTPKAAGNMRDVIPPPAPQPMHSATVPPPPSPSAVIVKRERFDAGTPKGGKKTRIEWPADVPTNLMLKSKSRSAVAHLTTSRVSAQQCFDPDLVFQQPEGELPLYTIFVNFPNALKGIAAVRGNSGNWTLDMFTREEEELYKSEVGIVYKGPSPLDRQLKSVM